MTEHSFSFQLPLSGIVINCGELATREEGLIDNKRKKGYVKLTADVHVLSRQAGLPLPDSDDPFEREQFERARRLFGRDEVPDADGKRHGG
jgi:hypothetical protein